MAQRQLVSTLPKDVLSQLHQRLIDSNFGDYSGHSDWLASLGFSISKSAIHRYSLANEVQIRLSLPAAKESDEGIRMRCLEMAERMVGTNDKVILFKQANEFLGWVSAF